MTCWVGWAVDQMEPFGDASLLLGSGDARHFVDLCADGSLESSHRQPSRAVGLHHSSFDSFVLGSGERWRSWDAEV